MLKIDFLGDSITEGYGTSAKENIYVNVLAKILPAEVCSDGIGGTRIAKQKEISEDPIWDLDFIGRVENLDKDADFVVVFGGTNDYGHGDAPIGKMGDKTPWTFYGAMDYIINELLKYFKLEQLIFILPLYRLNEDSPHGDGFNCRVIKEPLSRYREVMSEVLNKYGVRILDVKDKFGKAENNKYLLDGLHPNDEGHKYLAELIAEYIRSIM